MASGPKTLKPMPVKSPLKKGEYPGVPMKSR